MDEVLMLAAVPPEVRDGLAARFRLVRKGPDAGELGRFRGAVTTSVAGLDAAGMAALPGLRMLGCVGVGLDLIDVAEAGRRGIEVAHTPDAVRTDTADAAVALLYATVRRVAEADRFVRAGQWGRERLAPSRRVTGMKAGIVGLGHIGAMVAARLVGCGLEVAYTGPRDKGGPYRFVPDVVALAGWADVLVLCCPGGPATRGLVSAAVLDALGPRGFLVNVARGSVVDEAALLGALGGGAGGGGGSGAGSGSIAGAGLDVFAQEPGLDPAFRTLERVVLMPHYAAVTEEARGEMAATLVAAMERCFMC